MALNKDKKYAALGRLALLATTMIWGTSFVILKNTLDSVSTLYILAFRFTGAAVLMLLLGLREMKKLDMGYLKSGGLMGAFLFLAYVLQTYGLVYTTPGKNAFLTATYCVMVPFLYWAISRRRPDKYNIAAAFMSIAGIGLVSLNNDFSVGLGEGLTTLCGVFFALHIIATSRAAENRSVVLLTMIQFAVCGVLSWLSALIAEPFPTQIPAGAAVGIVYLCVMCTAATYLLQTFGQKYTPPSAVAVILTLEAVFGTVISMIFYGERLSLRLAVGFVVIFSAILVSETKLAFLSRKKMPEIEDDLGI